MLNPEIVFDELYEYVDLWSAGYVKAYLPDLDKTAHTALKDRLTESLIDRIETINTVRRDMGLDPMNHDAAYDYYINNMPEFNDTTEAIELKAYDEKTLQLKSVAQSEYNESESAKSHLIVMGAPEYFIEHSHVMQSRIDQVNRLLKEGGYPAMTPRKTEKMLINLLVVSNI